MTLKIFRDSKMFLSISDDGVQILTEDQIKRKEVLQDEKHAETEEEEEEISEEMLK